MDLEIFNKNENLFNTPLIDIKLIENRHLIFVKYTSELYYKYSIELIETLCKKSKCQNKKLLFYTTLNFLLRILYNCGNTPCLNNLDLIILCAFSIGIKSIENRNHSLSINGLKRIYPEKYYQYSNDEIKLGEIIIIKLLNYDINTLTSYECLFYLLNKRNNLNIFNQCIQHLDNLIISGDKKFIFKSPMNIAKETIEYVKIKEKEKINIDIIDLMKKKRGIFYESRETINFKKKKLLYNNESISTNSSSAVNLSNFVNNSINSSYKNKFQNFYLQSENVSYDKKPIEKNLKIKLIYEDNYMNNDIILNTKNNIIIEQENKFKNKNKILKFNQKTNYIQKRKEIKNCSSPNIFKKEIMPYKNNIKGNIEDQNFYNKEKSILAGKNKIMKNNIIKDAIQFRNINNNINFNYEKLNELCKKMNFEAFSNKKKL